MPNFVTSFDDTLPSLVGDTTGVGSPVAQAASTPTVSSGPSLAPTVSNAISTAAGLVNAASDAASMASGLSSGFTSFFGPRGIAIILGLLFIGGALLLFVGDDIAGALKIVAKSTA